MHKPTEASQWGLGLACRLVVTDTEGATGPSRIRHTDTGDIIAAPTGTTGQCESTCAVTPIGGMAAATGALTRTAVNRKPAESLIFSHVIARYHTRENRIGDAISRVL